MWHTARMVGIALATGAAWSAKAAAVVREYLNMSSMLSDAPCLARRVQMWLDEWESVEQTCSTGDGSVIIQKVPE